MNLNSERCTFLCNIPPQILFVIKKFFTSLTFEFLGVCLEVCSQAVLADHFLADGACLSRCMIRYMVFQYQHHFLTNWALDASSMSQFMFSETSSVRRPVATDMASESFSGVNFFEVNGDTLFRKIETWTKIAEKFLCFEVHDLQMHFKT